MVVRPDSSQDINRGLAHLLAELSFRADLREKVSKFSLEGLTSVAEQVRGRAGQREHAGHDLIGAADN